MADKKLTPREKIAANLAAILDHQNTIATAADMILTIPEEKRNRENKMYAVCESNIKLSTESRESEYNAIFRRVQEHVDSIVRNQETGLVDSKKLQQFAKLAMEMK